MSSRSRVILDGASTAHCTASASASELASLARSCAFGKWAWRSRRIRSLSSPIKTTRIPALPAATRTDPSDDERIATRSASVVPDVFTDGAGGVGMKREARAGSRGALAGFGHECGR